MAERMVEVGLLIAAGVFGAAMLWYGAANGKFTGRLLGYDASRPPDSATELLHGRPRDVRRVLDAWKVPSPDPETEHWRVLSHRRFRIGLAAAPLLLLLPILLGLVTVDIGIARARGGLLPAWVGGAVLLFGFWSVRLARIHVGYGSGSPLPRRALLTAAGGVVVGAILLVSLLLLTYVSIA